MILAKTSAIQKKMEMLFSEKAVKKSYIALVSGIPKLPHGEIIKSLSMKERKGNQVIWQVDDLRGQYAETHYTTLASEKGASFLLITPLTGKTHQIRIHLASIGCPVLGDKVYGGKIPSVFLSRQMLHAYEVSFFHPITNEKISLRAPLFPDMKEAIERLLPTQAKELLCKYS